MFRIMAYVLLALAVANLVLGHWAIGFALIAVLVSVTATARRR